MQRLRSIYDLKQLRSDLSQKEELPKINLCCGTACAASGAHKVAEAINMESQRKGLKVELVNTGCQGLCQKGPVMNILPHDYFYQKVSVNDVSYLLDFTFNTNNPYSRLLYRDDNYSDTVYVKMHDVPFYRKQLRIALRNNNLIDPTDIYQYIAVGGYSAFQKAISSMSPEDVLNEVDKANLRGRGGAGFPAGIKWKHAKSFKTKARFVIANGDEGDPGAFMDRSIMEGDPHSLLEGMLICAYAIEAEYGFIYVRHEYPLAVKNLTIAIKQAEEIGLLGKNILGTGMNFYLHIREGAGAFICGESTALIASIEGERGFARPRPPLHSEPGGGVWGYPSNLNNIESFACIPPIIEKGAQWFRSIGTETSSGTKVFALTGKVKNTGLIEVPMGITLREIIYDIGGGIIGDKKLKAVQTGGPSGGCIPASMIDLPVDFDSLTKIGSMMGSGGMVVMDEDTCMVDVAKYFLSFTQSESCGKCPPCRIGTYQMLQIMERITAGKGHHGDIEKLITLGKTIQKGSLCGLGKTAPNPILSTIKYFRDEFEEHVYDNFCRANVCKGTGVYIINQSECIRCGLCKEVCAFDAVKETRDRYSIENEYCQKCKACFEVCPADAIKIRKLSLIKIEERFKIPEDQLLIVEGKAKITLRDIMKSKEAKIVTCGLNCKVIDAILKMDMMGVSSILVLDTNQELKGIFTERDAMKCFTKAVKIRDEEIKKVMTRSPISLDISTDIGIAISIMSERKIRHLPVREDDKIVGMVSYRDLVTYLLPEVTFYTS
ncbi:MAG TPA: CBS domain-containing protein [Nitrospirae bacterium]|nr:CBS domain-containing protein [Nitrospirota bacterium]